MMIFSILPLKSSILVLTLGVFVYFRNRRNKININFFILCLSLFLWLFCYAIAFSKTGEKVSFYWLKLGYTGVIFSPAAFSYFVLVFLKKKYANKIGIIGYFVAFIFVFLLWFTPIFVKGTYKYFWGYYPRASTCHPLFLLYLSSFITGSIIVLFFATYRRKNKSLIFQRYKYVFWALCVGPLGSVDFIANYGLAFYPFGWIFIDIYISIVAYAIVKHRLMDISVAVTRTSIFIATYSLVLGIPFIIAYTLQPSLVVLLRDKWWLVPLGTSTVLATVVPFIYIYIDRKAEDRLLREQRQYQNTLRQASGGMIRIRELKRLLNLIVHVVTKTVKLEFASIFLADEENHHYSLAATRYLTKKPQVLSIDDNSELAKHFKKDKEPIVYEEIQLHSQDNPSDIKAANIEKELRELSAEVVVPSFVRDKLLGFIVLGKKMSGKMYSQDDLNVFSVLSNQAALAIENAQFYEQIQETQEQLFQAEKMATIGTMADGLSHQINNRFQALSLIAGDSLDILKTTDVSKASPELKETFEQIKYALERVQNNVMQGGEIVKGLLKYSRPGQTGFEPIGFNQVIDGAIEMAQYKVRLYEIDVEKNIPENLPKLKCNLTQLEEVFFNMIDNAYDAMRERKDTFKEEGYRGKIQISAQQQDSHVKIIFQDNGIGVKDKDKEKLFTPFFTTKVANKKGTGLGLYVIQKIIGYHNGTVSMHSTHKSGTKFEIILPLANR